MTTTQYFFVLYIHLVPSIALLAISVSFFDIGYQTDPPSLFKYNSNRKHIICSSILPIVSSIQSSRYELGSPAGLFGFCNKGSRCFFHIFGKVPFCKHHVSNSVNRFALRLMAICKTLFGIPSTPRVVCCVGYLILCTSINTIKMKYLN